MRTFIIALSAVALLACSSSSAPTDGSKDGGASTKDPNNPSDPAPLDEAGVPIVDGGTTPTNQVECIALCEKQHPKAASLSVSLDKECFLGGACEPVCNNLGTSGTLHQPTDQDGGTFCDTKKAQSFPITTYSQACSDCINTNARCCSLWTQLFGADATGANDGQALNNCANACYTKFPK